MLIVEHVTFLSVVHKQLKSSLEIRGGKLNMPTSKKKKKKSKASCSIIVLLQIILSDVQYFQYFLCE